MADPIDNNTNGRSDEGGGKGAEQAASSGAASFPPPPIPPPPPPPPPPSGGGRAVNGRGRLWDPTASPSDKTYAMLMHLSLLAVHFTGLIILIPLVMWLVRRHDSKFIDDHGKETVNFHISLTLYIIIMVVGGFLTCGAGWYIGIPAIWILGIVGMIMASIASNHGEYYRYPACIRFIR